MCFQVTNETDTPIAVIYSQWTKREVTPETGAMSELVLPSGISAVLEQKPYTEVEETRHRITIPASETLTIRYAASVEPQDGINAEQLADYVEPQQDGPL